MPTTTTVKIPPIGADVEKLRARRDRAREEADTIIRKTALDTTRSDRPGDGELTRRRATCAEAASLGNAAAFEDRIDAMARGSALIQQEDFRTLQAAAAASWATGIGDGVFVYSNTLRAAKRDGVAIPLSSELPTQVRDALAAFTLWVRTNHIDPAALPPAARQFVETAGSF